MMGRMPLSRSFIHSVRLRWGSLTFLTTVRSRMRRSQIPRMQTCWMSWVWCRAPLDLRPAPFQPRAPRVSVTGFGAMGSILFGRPRRFYGDDYHLEASFDPDRRIPDEVCGNLWREFYNFPESINPTGAWSYDGTFTGNGLADFLLSLPRSVSTIADPFYQDVWTWQTGFWFQDDWKVTPKLTVNLGLRWDIDDRWLAHSGRVATSTFQPPLSLRLSTRKRTPQGARAAAARL